MYSSSLIHPNICYRRMMNCYLCSGRSLTVLRTKLRHGITRNVLECRDCGLVYLQPREENLQRFYSEDYRDKHSPGV